MFLSLSPGSQPAHYQRICCKRAGGRDSSPTQRIGVTVFTEVTGRGLLPQRPGCPALLYWELLSGSSWFKMSTFSSSSSSSPSASLSSHPPICLQQASFYPDVSEEVRTRALHYGTECTLGYLDLLEHVLVVRRGMDRAGQSCGFLALSG